MATIAKPVTAAKLPVAKAAPAAQAPTIATAPQAQPAPPKPRDVRLRDQFFPDANSVIFDSSTKGYGPLPIMLRKVLRHISAGELRVLIYLYTRSSKYRLCYPTVEEIAAELGIHKKNLSAPIKKLEQVKLISTHTAGGKKYFLVHDPRIALTHLASEGVIEGDELFMVNQLATELGQQPIVAKPKTAKAAKVG